MRCQVDQPSHGQRKREVVLSFRPLPVFRGGLYASSDGLTALDQTRHADGCRRPARICRGALRKCVRNSPLADRPPPTHCGHSARVGTSVDENTCRRGLVLMQRPTGRPVLLATVLAATSLSSCLPAWTADTVSTNSPSFPTRFRGDWYTAPGPCHRDPNFGRPDRLALNVGATSLDYFDEFEGRLTHIVLESDRSVHYTAEYSAEGSYWNASEILRLSQGGNEMTLEPGRTSSRYYRCAGHRAE